MENKQKIVPFEEMNYGDYEVCVDDVSITYIQTGDCTEDRDACQDLTLTARNNGVARFINIKTGNNGWSINDPNDLVAIIKDFTKRALIK